MTEATFVTISASDVSEMELAANVLLALVALGIRRLAPGCFLRLGFRHEPQLCFEVAPELHHLVYHALYLAFRHCWEQVRHCSCLATSLALQANPSYRASDVVRLESV